MLRKVNINKNKVGVCERILREINVKESININDLELIWLHFENFSSLNIHKYTIFVDENIVFPFTHENENLMIEGKIEVFNHIIKVSKTKINTIRSIVKGNILKFECILPFGMRLVLLKPSSKYKEYDSQLRWKAQFINLAIVYLEKHPDSNLNCFKSDFFDWIKKHYNSSSWFKKWEAELPFSRDLSRQICANAFWIKKELLNTKPSLIALDIFHENSMGFKTSKKTLVTKHVFKKFEQYFESALIEIDCNENKESGNEYTQEAQLLTLRYPDEIYTTSKGDFKAGDFIQVFDPEQYYNCGQTPVAIITKIYQRSIVISFKVIFFMNYRDFDDFDYSNREIFLTESCNCKAEDVKLEDVIRKVSVKFSYNHDGYSHYFCKFILYKQLSSIEVIWESCVINDDGKLKCQCTVKNEELDFIIGQYYQILNKKLIEKSRVPILSIGKLIGESKHGKFKFQMFLSPFNDYNLLNRIKLKSNELLYTEKIKKFKAKNVVRPCYVTILRSREIVANNYHAAGNQFYVNRMMNENGEIVDLPDSAYPSDSRELSTPKLKLLDLFSGCGSFSRGIQDSESVECRWSIDIDGDCTNSNILSSIGSTAEFYQSNSSDILKDLVKNRLPFDINEVDMIISGPPCQGLSSLNRSRLSAEATKNNSLMANLLSYIDFIRPKFVLIEQVPSFTFRREVNSLEFDAFILFLVSIGYQIRSQKVDCANHCVAQNRTRLFIWGARVGYRLPKFPEKSSYSYNEYHKLCDEIDNISSFPKKYLCAMPPIVLDDAISDLPYIGDGSIYHKNWPDHVVVALSENIQKNIRILPYDSEISGEQWVYNVTRKKESKESKFKHYYKRADRYKPLQTVTGNITPLSISLNSIHYEESRVLSVRECARVQGFNDSDRFSGSINSKYKQIANAVPRPVAYAIALELKKILL